MNITSRIYLLACTIKMHVQTAATMKGPRQECGQTMHGCCWHGGAVHACYFSTIKNKKITFNIRDIGAMVQLFAAC